MREIELKFKVDNLEDVIKTLEENACKISASIYQNDTIYVKDLLDVESKAGSVWLRVRKTNDTVELNCKKQAKQKMESEEIEFEVSSEEKANAFLSAIGFKKWVTVTKERRYTKYKDCNVCIDQVKDLGNFVELEFLIQDENDINYEEELLSIAKKLHIDITNRVNSHYDTMIYEKKNHLEE